MRKYEIAEDTLVISFNELVEMNEEATFKDKYFRNEQENSTMLYSMKFRVT